jgi:hypothetical protein
MPNAQGLSQICGTAFPGCSDRLESLSHSPKIWDAPQRAERLDKNGLRLFCGGGILLAISHVTFMTNTGIPLIAFDQKRFPKIAPSLGHCYNLHNLGSTQE